MLKYTIFNEKGGVGKTTIASSIAEGLSRKGKKVLAIDFDTQSNLKNSFGDYLNENIKGTSSHLFVKDPKELDLELIRHKINDNLHLIISDEKLQGIKTELSSERGGGIKKFENFLKIHKLTQEYEYIICDLASENSTISDTLVNVANILLVPTTLEYDSINGVDIIINDLVEFDEEIGLNKFPKILIVPTMINQVKKKRNEEHLKNLKNLKDLKAIKGKVIITEPIKTNIRFEDSRNFGTTIYRIEEDDEFMKNYINKIARYKGTEDINRLIKTIMEVK